MEGLERSLVLVSVLLLLTGLSSAARMNTTVETVKLSLGERLSYPLVLHNPLDRPDTYDIGVGTVMDSGEASAVIQGSSRTSDRVQVHIGAGETKAVPVYYTGGACTSRTCTGTSTFVLRSMETGRRESLSVDIVVRRDTQVYGSPGITGLQVVVIGLLGAFFSLFLG
ncbi:MAG: hypothetical protein SVS85_00400 [Candidatus Nanohaloarchaea archaeon]|nr:hypothetical protein [Candidatus Nanohaloarchaea archaeon]